MPAAPWRAGLLLLLSLLCVRVCSEEQCALGVVGQPASLPCFHPHLLTPANVTVEWRRRGEVVLRASWDERGDVETCGVNGAAVSADAPLTGNFSLELPSAQPREDNATYSLFVVSQSNQSALVCEVCLRIAAAFSSPLLQREAAPQGPETVFLCQSSGGFPEPTVHWRINDTQEPPRGSVRTLAAALPHSRLYNVTSRLTVNVSADASVSCVIENRPLNRSWTSTSYGVRGGQVVVNRASEAMWMFSTGLCAVVGVMVAVGVAYQIHLDRVSRRKKKQYQQQQQQRRGRGNKRRCPRPEETEALKPPPPPPPKETDV